jgi:hypothetical protein
MRAEIKTGKREMKAAMAAGQKQLETPINDFRSDLEESINRRLRYQSSTCGLRNRKRRQKRGCMKEIMETSGADQQSILEYLSPCLPWKNERTDSEEAKSKNVKNLPSPVVQKESEKWMNQPSTSGLGSRKIRLKTELIEEIVE